MRDFATSRDDSTGASATPPTAALACARARGWTIAICAALLITFASLAWSAVIGKSATADEPYHAMAGWLHLWKSEYRFDSEDPPLWNTLAALVAPPGMMKVDPARMDWSNLPMDTRAQFLWEIQAQFQTPGNDPVAFINRFRAVMLTVAAAMGVLLAGFAWRLSRALGATPCAAGAAAVVATALLALDPNFLAHSPLMKNDIASAFALLGLTCCTWLAGRRLTLVRILALAVCSGVAMTVKFSGPLLVGSAASLLLIRALSRWPWLATIGWRSERLCVSRLKRIAMAAATIAFMGLISFAMIWLSYGLRFAPSPEPRASMNMDGVVIASLIGTWQAKHTDGLTEPVPTKEEVYAISPPVIVQLVNWANRRHALPQAFLAGLLYVFQASQMRATFLCGQSRAVGTWWYFPFAIAVKTPVATLAAVAAAAVAGGIWLFRRRPLEAHSTLPWLETWSLLCLVVPVLIYLGAAMRSNLNLGVRHVLPIYPLLYVGVGLAMAKLWDWRKTPALLAGLLIIGSLAIESCAAYPNYIPFFNVIAGGSRGGLGLLSDSNLDWGQDLPVLADWQKRHPDQKLYLAYFGTADPAYYGIRYTNLKDGYFNGPPAQPITSPGVLAISATTLQGPYCGFINNRPTWFPLWKLKPFEVLGDSIYLFHIPATRADHLPLGHSLIN